MNAPFSREIAPPPFVAETRIGFRFLGSQTWETHVIRVALRDLERLIPGRKPREPVVLDAGCGQGKSFRPLADHFAPQRIIAVDYEPQCIALAAGEAARQGLAVEVRRGDLSALEMPGESVDVVFCHQTFHHLTRQEETLAEFHRVLKPRGKLVVFWPHRRGSSVLFLHALRRLIRLVSGAEPKFHPDEISLLGSRAEAATLLRDTGFVLREYSFGLRDLFVQCVIVAERVEPRSTAAAGRVSARTTTA